MAVRLQIATIAIVIDAVAGHRRSFEGRSTDRRHGRHAWLNVTASTARLGHRHRRWLATGSSSADRRESPWGRQLFDIGFSLRRLQNQFRFSFRLTVAEGVIEGIGRNILSGADVWIDPSNVPARLRLPRCIVAD